MKTIGIYYGSSTDVTASVAEKIASRLGIAAGDLHNVDAADAASALNYEVLLLGSSTWGAGDLQDDWESFLPKLKAQDLNGKLVGFFGCGDAACYSDTFCDAPAIIKDELADKGCTFIGRVPAEGYDYDESRSEENGELIGCMIDDVNEADRTEERIDCWVNSLRKNL